MQTKRPLLQPSSLIALFLLAAGLFGPAATGAPSYVLIAAPQGTSGGETLARQLAKWRQLGLVADAQLLERDESDADTFARLGIMEFPNETALDRWREVGQSELGDDLLVIVADALSHGEKTPRNSNRSVFAVMQYDVPVPRDRFEEYLAAYQTPSMQARMGERIMNRYTNFYARAGSPAPWQSLLVMEYRDPHSYAISADLNKGISERLSAEDSRYRAFRENKYDYRQKTATTRAHWVELPPPDLGELPDYRPETRIKGSLRILGSELKNSVDLLAEGFTYFHPDVRVATSHIPSSEGAIAGLYLGVSDLAPMGDDAKITDLMPFYNTFGYLPTEISVATGGYEKRGSLFAWAIAVNQDNPLRSISVEQIKRIFGGERTGGWEINNHNYKFTAAHAVSREDLIRTWDQLGLGGRYAGREIETFGYAAPGFSISVERHLFHWSKKWNPNFREYVEAKQATPDEQGLAVSSERPLEDLETNPFAIGIVALMHAKHYPNVKILPVSAAEGGEAITLTPENVATRRYPLIRDAYFYVNKAPDRPLDPIVREFMRYCLSRQGQESIVRAGYYYPLPRDYLQRQLQKLD